MKDYCENKTLNKYESKIKKASLKLLKNTTMKQYINTLGSYQSIVIKHQDKDLIITSSYFANISTRRTIVNTLKSINYKRGNADWNEKVAIAFISEVMDLYLYEADETIISACEKEISKRYNVKSNRLKTQVALFINNYEKGKDKFNMGSYFSDYEIIKWKYRDIEKLQDIIEKDSLNKKDEFLLKRLDIIE